MIKNITEEDILQEPVKHRNDVDDGGQRIKLYLHQRMVLGGKNYSQDK